jgi:sarcosine oxidase
MYVETREDLRQMSYDVCVIGLGAMGTAATLELASRGASVVALDQFSLGHDRGSSHGETRIIRSVYMEGNIYDPLLKAAYEGWHRLEKEIGRKFLHLTGGLDISLVEDGAFEAALEAAMAGGHEHDVLDGPALEARFPLFDLKGKARAVYAPGSGLLDSDAATMAMRAAAQRQGAELRGDCQVMSWSRSGSDFEIETATGSIHAKKLIIAAGAWTEKLLPGLKHVLIPERQVVGWFDVQNPDSQSIPIFQIETEARERFYGFPPHKGQGLKLGLFHHRYQRGPDFIAPQGIDNEDERRLSKPAKHYLRGINPKPQRLMECRFTLAPDDRFLIGPWPDDPDITLLSPCSGHGYKFVPAIGEIAADLVMEKEPSIDIGPFSVERVF